MVVQPLILSIENMSGVRARTLEKAGRQQIVLTRTPRKREDNIFFREFRAVGMVDEY